jgi:DNA repair exonuclease SbcCD ATPase subunit
MDPRVDKCVIDFKESHTEEAAIALKLYVAQAQRAVCGQGVQALFDSVFNSRECQLALLPFFDRKGTSVNELAAFFGIVQTITKAPMQALQDNVQRIMESFHATVQQHLSAVACTALTRSINNVMMNDRHETTQRMHERVEFVESEFNTRITMIANHEARELNAHITSTLLGKTHDTTSGPRKPSDSGRELTSEELNAVLAECAKRLRPETLQRMSADAAKEALLQSLKREQGAWGRVQALERRISDQEAAEARRQAAFETTLSARTAKAIAEAQDHAASLQSELNRTRQQRRELQEAAIAAKEIIARVDERAALLAQRLRALSAATLAAGGLPPEFNRAERQLAEVREDWRDVEKSTCATGTVSGLFEAHLAQVRERLQSDDTRARELLEASFNSLTHVKLISDESTIPPVDVSREQRATMDALLDLSVHRQAANAAKSLAERLQREVARLREAQIKVESSHRVERRSSDAKASSHVSLLAAENAALRAQVAEYREKLAVATTETVRLLDDGGGLGDDLVRKLRAREAEIMSLRADHDRTVAAGSSAASRGSTPRTESVPQAKVPMPPPSPALIKPASTMSRGIVLDDAWLVDRHFGRCVPRPPSAQTKSENGCGLYRGSDGRAQPSRPRSARTPRTQQLKVALMTLKGPAFKPGM